MMSGKNCSHAWCKVLVRALIAAVFIYAGYNKLTDIAGTAGAISAVMKWPMPTLFAWIAGLIEFVGGIVLVTGYYKKWASGALIVLTIVATYYFHFKGALAGDGMQLIQVLKNLAIVGALSMFADCCKYGSGDGDSCEGGKCGVEEKKA